MAKIKAAIEEHRADPRLIDERGPTKERANKLRPSPINLAVADGRLTREQGVAAEKFYIHWFRSGRVGRTGSLDLDRVFGGTSSSGHDKQQFHRDRLDKALTAVYRSSEAGPISRDVLIFSVIDERSFVDIGSLFGHKNRNSASRIALGFLRPALNILCKEWGIT